MENRWAELETLRGLEMARMVEQGTVLGTGVHKATVVLLGRPYGNRSYCNQPSETRTFDTPN